MEANSGVKFEQAQVALARQWMGDQADQPSGVDPIKEVFLKASAPIPEGIVELGKATEVELLKVPLPQSAEETRETVAKFESGAERIS